MAITRPKTANEFWGYTREAENGCIEWTGPRDVKGYGVCFWMGVTKAHLVAYQLGIGSLQEGQRVYRTCQNKVCCNPAHMTTTAQSVPNRGGEPNTVTCRKGLHPWVPQNIKTNKNGTRQCLPCDQAATQRRKELRQRGAEGARAR